MSFKQMEEKNNIKNSDWDLIAKYLTDELDQEEIELWLKQSEGNKEELRETRQILLKIDSFYRSKKFNSNTAWKNINSKIYPKKSISLHQFKRKEVIQKFYKYAAIIVLALLVGSAAFYMSFIYQNPVNVIQTVQVQGQGIADNTLPDGSLVTLNSNSQLEFPKKFKKENREVTLTGEAFFDIQPNPDRPFIIIAGNTRIKVVGTSFNVNAYPESETVEIIVESGIVQVEKKNTELQTVENNISVRPGEKVTFFNENNELSKSINTNLNFIAWKTHNLVFNEVPLSEVIKCLEEVYHTDIQINNPELESLLYTGQFDQKPIDFILDVIRLTFNLELTEENEHFVLSGRINN